MEELWMILWRERDLLDALADELAATGRALADGGAGRTGGAAAGTGETDAVLATLRGTELLRAVVADDLAAGLGLASGASLRELAAGAPEPWRHLLGEHRIALVAQTRAIATLEAAGRGDGLDGAAADGAVLAAGAGPTDGPGGRRTPGSPPGEGGDVLVLDPPWRDAGAADGVAGTDAGLATVVDLRERRRARAARAPSYLQRSLVDFLR
ncbi:hypothetical protein INN71_17640 [Nocardioides sp. ChNu-153]|uniref:hypothetical protein n=1 Tax=unclassified Nocardioides TaxID=2615069 RepID=UPI002406A692|nr:MULTISPECIES: hypothetical protein [unclassified Nocardioides]MDF9717754.1 hypothetical protein [Nocardioides sp. ChNu-99]MDN7123207.1 hypothetical protein [Nocardioides sp. ChNu-153]